MKTKEFNEIVDLFCIELEKQREFNDSTLNLINKIVRYSNNKEYALMDFERDLYLIKNLTFVKYMLCEHSVTNIDVQLKNQIHLIKTILQNKAKEYSKDENRLHNFYVGSNLSLQSPIDVCFGYMLKHICSVYDILVQDNLTKKISQPIDVIQEKFNDLINYIILMHAVKKHEFNITNNIIEKELLNSAIQSGDLKPGQMICYGTGNSTGEFDYKRSTSTSIPSIELGNDYIKDTFNGVLKSPDKKETHYININLDNEVEIKIKKLCNNEKIPVKSTEGACGYDVYANMITTNVHETQCSVYFGFAVEIPKGYALEFIPRSSICKTGFRLTNCVGLIDSDYRGEVYVTFDIIDKANKNNYKIGDRVGQFVVIKDYKSKFVEVDELSDTKRGDGGFGSTGK
jgi:dUTP pyrophosphatase